MSTKVKIFLLLEYHIVYYMLSSMLMQNLNPIYYITPQFDNIQTAKFQKKTSNMTLIRGGGRVGPGGACAPPKLSVHHLKWGIDIDLILACPTINRLYPICAPPVAAFWRRH